MHASGGQRGNAILLVDDDEPVRGLCRTALERHGYSVMEAGNATDALAIVASHGGSLSLVLTDIVMPGGMDGATLGASIQRLYPGLPVLYMTGFTRRADDLEPMLRKPFSLHELVRVVEDALGPPPDPR